MLRALLKLTLMAYVLGGCAYHGPANSDIDNPAIRKVAWFSYLDGNDIREHCVAGSPDRFRLVYNGQYEKQIRSYEITQASPNPGGAYFTARALGQTNLFEVSLDDLLAPWRWQKSETKLSSSELDQFRGLLTQSGWGNGAPQGKLLHSRDFYWVASGCRDGQFHFDAWVDAQGDFRDVKFQDFLLARDKTGVAFRKPTKVLPIDRTERGRPRDRSAPIFALTVQGEGIGGLVNAF
ncbi:MAG TPA: hypothetical protein VFE34_07835 [Dongiaceae bacterium]|nr:hypothetical protein [Dongiaceae bacterium]